jgi:hypothetical protein
MLGLEAGPVKVMGAARQKGVKGLFKVTALERREFKDLVLRKDLVIGKALTVDLALADASGGEGLVIGAGDEVDDKGSKGRELVLEAEAVKAINIRLGGGGSDDGVKSGRERGRAKRSG